MKTKTFKILLLVLLTTMISTAQTQVDLSNLTSNVILGNDCSSSEAPDLFESLNANLNGHTITLRNSKLKINSNLNGPGEIRACGNSNSQICISGTSSNNVILQGIQIVDCSVLETESFESLDNIPKNLEYSLYNLIGQEIYKGNTSLLYIPLNQILIIKVDGFQSKKIFVE